MEKSSEVTNTKILEKDSVSYKDSVYHTKPDTAKIQANVIVDINGAVNLPEIGTETHSIKHSVGIKNGKLISICVCKDLELQLKIKERLIQRLYSENFKTLDIKDSLKTVQVPFLPWWAKILNWIGGISLLIIIIYIAFKLIKLYYKPL
jgi:hypothetical protein